ncbi:MAG: hypothetical protein B6242_08865 [Anaerolineaceae bacterium 4572_78]|nr:MAG: hypothetical protein B6242_08865 [Anaerolineaceae bacterium 4572_78]
MNIQVGFISYGLDRSPGGIGRYMKEMLAILPHKEVEVTTLHAGRTQSHNGTVSLPGAKLLPGLLTIGQIEIGLVVKQQNLDIIHDSTGCIPLMFAGTKRVATIYDVIPYIYPETSSKLDWLIYRFWLPKVVHHIDAVFTISQQSKQDIMKYLKVKPEKIFNMSCAANSTYQPMTRIQINPILRKHGINFPYILYVGSIEARKNLKRLLESFALLLKQLPQAQLVIVGAKKWKFTPIFETVQRLNLESHLHFTGYIPDEDLPAIYNGADVFVFPSLYEGFGLPVLEAMACGTPVITSNISSLPEVAGKAALYVFPKNIQEITDAMYRLLTDSALADDLRTRGLTQAKKFSWEKTAQETIAVYKQICSL